MTTANPKESFSGAFPKPTVQYYKAKDFNDLCVVFDSRVLDNFDIELSIKDKGEIRVTKKAVELILGQYTEKGREEISKLPEKEKLLFDLIKPSFIVVNDSHNGVTKQIKQGLLSDDLDYSQYNNKIDESNEGDIIRVLLPSWNPNDIQFFGKPNTEIEGTRIQFYYTGQIPKKAADGTIYYEPDVVEVKKRRSKPKVKKKNHTQIDTLGESKLTSKSTTIVETEEETEKLFSRPDSWHGVVGQETAVKELEKITTQLSRIEEFRAMGTNVEQGILLYGEPGVGKTSLANGLAEAIGAQVIEIDCNIFSKWIHDTEENLIKKFNEAAQISKKGEKVLIILNEINAIAPSRDAGNSSSSDYKHDQTETFLITVEKTLKENPDLVVIGTTNYLDKVDKGAQRPGRLGLKISCDLPQNEKEVSDLIKFAAYSLLDRANNYRKIKKSPQLNIGDIFSLDEANLNQMSEVSSRLIGYPQATIVRGVEKAMRTKVDKSTTKTEALTVGEIYTGILEYSVIPTKEQNKAGDWFTKIR